ncbi:MAG TPA: RNA-binding cell elongation regulator Jag/EloR [Acidimicrobiia bacterium]|jgi:spoIIIJ-associated protein
MEWVEVEAPSVTEAVELAVKELGLQSVDDVDVEVIREAKKGFLGVGAQDALVKVLPKATTSPSRRRRRRGRSGGSSREGGAPTQTPQGESRGGQQGEPRSGQRQTQKRPQSSGRKPSSKQTSQQQRRRPVNDNDDTPRERTETPTVSIDDQATVASEFVEGLLSAFGLEGAVTTRVDEDVLYIDVSGDQTEALVGARGSIMHAVLELTRTVVQRKTFGAPRMRLDIAGYAERRREALKIYAAKLAEKVLADGGEVMLEPMNPADRKVVHDAIAEIDGVRSYSEGEDPERCVIVAAEG